MNSAHLARLKVNPYIISEALIKVAPYSFQSARALISKISRWRELSNPAPKSRAKSRSKMSTKMASKLLKLVYRKCCVDRLRIQNIYWLNRRPYLPLLDLKEKWSRYAPRSSSGAKQGSMLPRIFAVLVVVCGADTKAKIWVRMWRLTSSRSTSWRFEIENNKTQQTTIEF